MQHTRPDEYSESILRTTGLDLLRQCVRVAARSIPPHSYCCMHGHTSYIYACMGDPLAQTKINFSCMHRHPSLSAYVYIYSLFNSIPQQAHTVRSHSPQTFWQKRVVLDITFLSFASSMHDLYMHGDALDLLRLDIYIDISSSIRRDFFLQIIEAVAILTFQLLDRYSNCQFLIILLISFFLSFFQFPTPSFESTCCLIIHILSKIPIS